MNKLKLEVDLHSYLTYQLHEHRQQHPVFFSWLGSGITALGEDQGKDCELTHFT